MKYKENNIRRRPRIRRRDREDNRKCDKTARACIDDDDDRIQMSMGFFSLCQHFDNGDKHTDHHVLRHPAYIRRIPTMLDYTNRADIERRWMEFYIIFQPLYLIYYRYVYISNRFSNTIRDGLIKVLLKYQKKKQTNKNKKQLTGMQISLVGRIECRERERETDKIPRIYTARLSSVGTVVWV